MMQKKKIAKEIVANFKLILHSLWIGVAGFVILFLIMGPHKYDHAKTEAGANLSISQLTNNSHFVGSAFSDFSVDPFSSEFKRFGCADRIIPSASLSSLIDSRRRCIWGNIEHYSILFYLISIGVLIGGRYLRMGISWVKENAKD